MCCRKRITPSVKATMHVSLHLGATSRIRALLSILHTLEMEPAEGKMCIRGKRPVCSILSVPRWTDGERGVGYASLFFPRFSYACVLQTVSKYQALFAVDRNADLDGTFLAWLWAVLCWWV